MERRVMLTVNNNPRQQSDIYSKKDIIQKKSFIFFFFFFFRHGWGRGSVLKQENTSRRFQFLSSCLSLSAVQLSPRSFSSCDSCHISLSFVPLSTAAAALTRVCQTQRPILSPSPQGTAFLPPLLSTSAPGSFTLTLSLSSYLFSLFSGHDRQSVFYSRSSFRGFWYLYLVPFFIVLHSLSLSSKVRCFLHSQLYVIFCWLCSCTGMPGR